MLRKEFQRVNITLHKDCRMNQYSTKPILKENHQSSINESSEKYSNEMHKMSTIFPRNRTKLPQRSPFAKNLFLGNFDTEILVYPQLPKSDKDQLEEDIETLMRIQKVSCEASNFKEYVQFLKNMRCLGLQSTLDDGGRELNQTERCRFNEVLFSNKNKFRHNLYNNELCILALSKFGTETQKKEIMQKLIDGDQTAVMIHGENSSKIMASYGKDNKFSLNGKKMFVVSVDEADYFIVFAYKSHSIDNSQHGQDLTAFLVDKNSPGITITRNDMINLKGTSSISFENTSVSNENILGTERGGRSVLSSTLPDFFLDYSVMNLNILKDTLNFLANDVLSKSEPNHEIHKTEAMTSELCKVIMSSYMVESAIYLTTGMMSLYENQDCELESLLTRTLSSELAVTATKIGFSLVGTPCIDPEHTLRKLHEEALSNYTIYEHENSLKILIALMGLQYCGKQIGDSIKKLRNPLFHPGYILKKMWRNRMQEDDSPSLNVGIKNYLHPSLQTSADRVEYCVQRLQYATESLLGRYGMDVLNRHCHLMRLAEVSVRIYAMIACLGRSSRSYCIGLRHSNLEILLTDSICEIETKVVKQNISSLLFDHQIVDNNWNELAKNLFDQKKYYFAHPLSRNF